MNSLSVKWFDYSHLTSKKRGDLAISAPADTLTVYDTKAWQNSLAVPASEGGTQAGTGGVDRGPCGPDSPRRFAGRSGRSGAQPAAPAGCPVQAARPAREAGPRYRQARWDVDGSDLLSRQANKETAGPPWRAWSSF